MTNDDKSASHQTSDYNLLSDEEVRVFSDQMPEWSAKEKLISRLFEFKDFDQAMDFTMKVADVARQENHHPEICINYNKVLIQLSTHKVGGLTRKDFKVASRIDSIITNEVQSD